MLGQAPLQKNRGTHVTHKSKTRFLSAKILKLLALKDFNVALLCHPKQENSDILLSPQGRNAVKMYNQTAASLVKFECIYHQAWLEEVSQMNHGWLKLNMLITLMAHRI